MRRARVVLLALAIVGATAPVAVAGPLEELIELAVHPTDADVMALRYEYGGEGLAISRDGGATWQALCAGGMQPTGLDRPPAKLGRMLYGADGSLYMATFGALLQSDPSGCAWSAVGPFTGEWVSDVTRLASDPSVLFAVTSSGGADERNGVYRKQGDADWEALGTQEAMLISRLHVAELGGGGLRLYESASRGIHCASDVCGVDEMCCKGDSTGTADPVCSPITTTCEHGPASGAAPNYLIRVSDDLGETWTEHPFPETDGTLHLEAVDPTDPDRLIVVVVRTNATLGGVDEAPDSIYVSEDAGATFTEWTTVQSFGGLALASDGRVWLGDRGDPANVETPKGLSSAPSLDAAPTMLQDELPVSCLAYLADGERLLACRRFDAAFADPATGAYTAAFDFRGTERMLDCPDKDLCALCERQLLLNWCGITHFPEAPMCCCYPDADRLMDPNYTPGADAGVSLTCPIAGAGDAGTAGTGAAGDDAAGGTDAGAAGTGAAGDEGGCSCHAAGAHRRSAPLLLSIAFFAAVAWRSRRRRVRPSR